MLQDAGMPCGENSLKDNVVAVVVMAVVVQYLRGSLKTVAGLSLLSSRIKKYGPGGGGVHP